jgi:hypothetical protein
MGETEGGNGLVPQLSPTAEADFRARRFFRRDFLQGQAERRTADIKTRSSLYLLPAAVKAFLCCAPRKAQTVKGYWLFRTVSVLAARG